VNVATAGAIGDAPGNLENEAILLLQMGDNSIILGMPTFGCLTVPTAPGVPSTFIGILGHKWGVSSGLICHGKCSA
jgi:hypothetical protein